MRRRFGLIVLGVLLCATGVGSARAAEPLASAGDSAAITHDQATRLIAVSALDASGRTVIKLRGNGRLVPRTVEEARDLPPRVLVDLPGVSSGVPLVTPVDSASVARVRVGANSVNPLVTRVVVDLKQRVPYTVEQNSDEITLVLGLDATPASASLNAPASKLTARPVRTPLPSVAAIAHGPLPFTALPADLKSTTAKGMPLLRTFMDTSRVAPPSTQMGARGAAPRPAARPASADAPIPVPPPPAPADAQIQIPSPSTITPSPVTPPASMPESAIDKQFTGHPVSLDFQGVDLRAVLRTFSEITGLNIVIDPSVQGTVDVALKEVPWDQALDIILRANQLGYTVEGNIVRIAPLNKLREEQDERRKLADARALSGDLSMLSRTLSYAKAEDMTQLLTRAALTQRGSIQVDKRTNTLIIRDLPGGLDAARQLIETLDTAQPQVEIEARIVQTNRNFLRELGVQWGIGGEASQRLGNSTPLTFPNQVAVNGSSALPTTNPAQNLLRLATSSVNGAMALDVALSAAERAGKVRILSTPRVSTQNNVEAEISQGTQIPVQTVANNTVTVTFKDATLTLKVRPQITSADTVIMNVVVENGSPDYSRQVNGIPPIDTQRANTQVQVIDGATTVIGGIFVSNERNTEDRIPGLHRLPLLGWLFKSNNNSESSQELLIFLTPRIIKN